MFGFKPGDDEALQGKGFGENLIQILEKSISRL
jgi:hypothetical protein